MKNGPRIDIFDLSLCLRHLAVMIDVNAISLAVVVPFFIGKSAQKTHQTFVLSSTMTMGMA